MRKWILLFLCLLLLTGCEKNEVNPELVITCAPREEVPVEEIPQETQGREAERLGTLLFRAEGADLIPGDPFDPGVLPEPESLYQVPSCAIEGTDNLYNYGAFELTAFHDGTGEVIYSILLLDPNVTTPEGLALGDSSQRVTELYGSGYAQEGTALVYTGENGRLYIILQNDAVASIEYRMITE